MEEQDDEVVVEMEVFLTQELADQLHVLQYPLRPQWKPHNLSKLKSVRHRRLQRAMQLELELDTTSPHYNDLSRYPIATSVLNSTLVPAQTNHCIGVVSDGKVHLTPLHAVVQMRPLMAHLDAEDIARREEREREMKSEKRAGRQDSTASLEANNDDDENGKDDDDMQMLQVQFRRAESEKVLERKRTSYASLHEAREREPWVELAYHASDSDESEHLRAQLLCGSKAHIPLTCSSEEYLARLSCGKAHHRGAGEPGHHLGMPIDLEQDQLASPDQAGLSKEALRQMRPADRAAAILRHTHVMAFSRLCELCGMAPSKQLLDEVMDVAVLVQGCWVLRSALACSTERDARSRDTLLLHFTRERTVSTRAFAERAKLPTHVAREMLAKVATPRPGQGWEFKLPTDTVFEEQYPHIAAAQREEWQRVASELGRQALSAASTMPVSGLARDGGGAAGAKRGKAAALGSGGKAAAAAGGGAGKAVGAPSGSSGKAAAGSSGSGKPAATLSKAAAAAAKLHQGL